MLIVMSANIFGGLICLILGIRFFAGRPNSQVSCPICIDTTSEEARDQWKQSAVNKFQGWLYLLCTLVLWLACIPIWFELAPVAMILTSWGIVAAALVAGSIYMNVSPRFRPKDKCDG